MLVPVQGGVANLQKRTRTIFEQEAALSTVDIPKVYIFNVGPREWRGIGGGRAYKVPSCKPGQSYSEPVEISSLCLSEIDLADGGGNMSTHIDPGMNGTRTMPNGEKKHVIGVANDVIGTNSTAAALGLHTTNGEWFGIFVTANQVPAAEELEAANGKLRQMMQLIYAAGAEKVQAGEKVQMIDRPIYNEAAAYLGAKQLWGNLDHTRASCPECHEDIIDGANFCKHCQQAIDPASVAARAKKRAKEAAKLLSEEDQA